MPSPGRRARWALAVVALLLPLLVQPAHADQTTTGGGADNVVLAFNNADGASRSASRVAVAITAAEQVGTENLAYSKSSCSDCRTVSVAIQAVPIVRDVDVIVPKNAAVAVNAGCDSCRTAAFAYQYVFTTGGPVRLSEAGRQAVAAIRAEADTLAASGLDFSALETELDELAARFRAVIDDELSPVGAGELRKRIELAGTAG